MSRFPTLVAVALLGAMVTGCAGTASPEAVAQNDPWEPTNRAFFDFDVKLDHYIASPIAHGYNYAVPSGARDSIHNVLTNLDSPVVFANDVLQGETKRAGQTLWRAVINSTFGLGGLIDAAGRAGVPGHDEDFGQTLAVWGVGEGPYLVLPFLGPKPPRDLAGMFGDVYMDPLTYTRFRNSNTWGYVRTGMGVLDYRAANVDAVDQIERSSIDYYATTRSLYRQHRDAEIRNGAADTETLPQIQ